MNVLKEYSRRSLFWIILVMGALCIVVDLIILLGLRYAIDHLAILAIKYAKVPEMIELIRNISQMIDQIKYYYVPVSAAIFVLFIFFLWSGLRYSFSKQLKLSGHLIEAKKEVSQEPEPIKDTTQNDQRLFLHLLAALQKDGRLLDFLAEDLETYADEQIGAAVRSIHDNCKRTLSKYLVTEPVIKEQEGDQYTVLPNFDPSSIKLTGNVVGDPPFKGIVRHRGWRVSKFEMPILSGSRDPNLIAPAEIEIV